MDWITIRKEYESTGITLKELAAKHGAKEGTMRSRKNREKWQRNKATQRATKKSVATKRKQMPHPEKNKINEIEISPELTEKQRLFCLYYIKSYNATMSAIKAGYAKDRAHVTGSELVRNSKVSGEIRRLKGRALQDLYIDALDVLEVYAKIAFADITECVEFGSVKQYVYVEGQRMIGIYGDYLTQDVGYVNIKNHDEIDGALISEVKQGKEGISVKFHDKMKALDVLTKYFDLLPDNHKRKIEEANLALGKRRVAVTEKELELRKAENDLKSF